MHLMMMTTNRVTTNAQIVLRFADRPFVFSLIARTHLTSTILYRDGSFAPVRCAYGSSFWIDTCDTGVDFLSHVKLLVLRNSF